MIIELPATFEPAIWGGITFLAGVACKGIIDSYLRRRDDAHKFLLDRRVRFLEEQLSLFYWPIYLILQKDNWIWDRIRERDQDPDSPQSKLSIAIDSGVVLPNHKEAMAVIEAHLHLAADPAIVESSLRYVRHVQTYEMLRAAGIKADPINHGVAYPSDYFGLVEKRVLALQSEYESSVFKLKA